jgi:CBS domain containing-hemolysin-like protein
LLLIVILFAASGAILALRDAENKHKGNPRHQFVSKNHLMIVEAMWIAEVILFIVIALCVWQLLDRLAMSGAYIVLSATGICLSMMMLLALVKRSGASRLRSLVFVYPFIRIVWFLFAPVVRLSFTANSNKNETADLNAESGIVEDSRMIEALQNTTDIDVKDILSSRMDLTAVDISVDFDTLYSIVVESGYSRLPVYEDDLDHIKGILYVKDLLPYIRQSKDFDWTNLIHEAYFVLEHKKINALLDEMKKKKVHMAIVVDEYGGTTGIVTLEDILEEIVGEIFDESDIESDETFFVKQKDNSYMFKGKTPLVDFCRIMQIDHDMFESSKGDTETLAGLLLELKGEFLQKGEELRLCGLTFRVESADDRRIRLIRVTKD